MDIIGRSYMLITSGSRRVNLLTPKSDLHPISPYIITPKSNIKVMRIKDMIKTKEAPDC